RVSGAAIPTRSSRSIARSRATSLDTGSCSWIASTIWSPTLCTADKDVIGSWKTIEIRLPLTARMIAGSAPIIPTMPSGASAASGSGAGRRRRRRSPRKLDLRAVASTSAAGGLGTHTWPPTILPGRSTSCRIERAITLFPQPDSPTTANVSPRRMVRLTPSTAFTTPSSSWNSVRRLLSSSTDGASGSSRRSGVGALVGVCCITQSIADEVHGQDSDEESQAGEHEPRRGLDRPDVLRVLEEHTPADRWGLQSEAEEAQGGLAEDHAGDRHGQRGDQVAGERGHHVAEDDPRSAAPVQQGCGDEVLLP